MVLDLTLNAIQIPGLPTFTRIFGTKKADGKGLSTGEVNANMLAPWNRQRPFTVAEISSTGVVEADACIAISTGCTAITLGDGAFTGVRVLLINTTPSAIQLITGQESGYILAYQTLEIMWFGDCWYVCDGHMVGEILNVTFPLTTIPFGYMSLHSGLRPSRTAYKRLANTILFPLTNVTFTCTTATPAVFTVAAGHGFTGGERLRLFTSGALTGATLAQDYFVEYISTTTFYLLTLEGGTTRLAITAQSGTHYYQCSAYGVGDGSTTMDLPDPRQSAFVGAGTGTTHNIASVDLFLNGQWKDDQFEEHYHYSKVSRGYNTNSPGGSTNAVFSGSIIDAERVGMPATAGTYGIRTGAVTRGKRIGTNYLIKY